jgi:nucleoside 2-deoxyribosyltransferase
MVVAVWEKTRPTLVNRVGRVLWIRLPIGAINMTKRIYLAGPLFTQGERTWNAALASGLRSFGHTVFLPQENDAEIVTSTGGLTARERRALFEMAVRAIRDCDVVVAVLDGPDADSGTSFECGFAFAIGRPAIGVRTDFRFGGDAREAGVNLMLSESCAQLIWIGDDAIAHDHAFVAGRVDQALQAL